MGSYYLQILVEADSRDGMVARLEKYIRRIKEGLCPDAAAIGIKGIEADSRDDDADIPRCRKCENLLFPDDEECDCGQEVVTEQERREAEAEKSEERYMQGWQR